MTLGYNFTCSLDGCRVLPATLEEITFGYRFNRPVDGVVWRVDLRWIIFGDVFNRSISGVTWPPKLEVLKFGFRFNQMITDEVVFLRLLEELWFGHMFQNPLTGCELPK